MRRILADATRDSATTCAREIYLASLGAGGSLRDKADLEVMAANVVGRDLGKEMITCCDTGRPCSGRWFMLSEVLGCKDVKFYDGSVEERAKDGNALVVKFSWN